jgi:hypothetical protein
MSQVPTMSYSIFIALDFFSARVVRDIRVATLNPRTPGLHVEKVIAQERNVEVTCTSTARQCAWAGHLGNS